MRRLKLLDARMEAYQIYPSGFPVVPQIHSEVRLVHELKNEGKWVFLGGINANKRYKALATVIEAAAG